MVPKRSRKFLEQQQLKKNRKYISSDISSRNSLEQMNINGETIDSKLETKTQNIDLPTTIYPWNNKFQWHNKFQCGIL